MDNIIKLQEQVKKFCEDRDWDQFHNPKDLAIGISTEANELLDIFRFKQEEDINKIFMDELEKEKVEEEIADVFFFLLRFSQMNQINLAQVLENKIVKNEKKYPVDKARGSNKKYTEL